MSYLDIKFPYYPNNISIVKPLGHISIKEFIRAVSNPKENVKQLFLDIKNAADKGDLKLKGELKKKLYYFTPCIDTDGLGRSYSNITSFSGLVQVDFDGLTNATEFRDWFFENCKSCILCGLSPSGYGIKALVKIPKVKTVNEYKEYFCGMAVYLEKFKGFDRATFNPSLALYMFYDPDLKWREDATVSTVRGVKINAFDPNKTIDFEITDDIDEEVEKLVVNKINFLIGRIEDNAHPQLLGISFLIGGWAGANFIGEELAFDTMNEAIENNDYMSKDTRGYLRTAKSMYLKGVDNPAEFKN